MSEQEPKRKSISVDRAKTQQGRLYKNNCTRKIVQEQLSVERGRKKAMTMNMKTVKATHVRFCAASFKFVDYNKQTGEFEGVLSEPAKLV